MTIEEILKFDPKRFTLETFIGGKHSMFVAQLSDGSEEVEGHIGEGDSVVKAIEDLAVTLTAANWQPAPTY